MPQVVANHLQIDLLAQTASDPDKKWRKAHQAALRLSELDYDEVGSSIGRIVVQRDVQEERSPRPSGGSQSASFMVRGHWRRQAHGPAAQERKLICIAPFYKGPELAMLTNKPYVVR